MNGDFNETNPFGKGVVRSGEDWFSPEWQERADVLCEMADLLQIGAERMFLYDHGPSFLHDHAARIIQFFSIVEMVDRLIGTHNVSSWGTGFPTDPIVLLIARVKSLRSLGNRPSTKKFQKELEKPKLNVVPLDPDDCRWWPLIALYEYIEAMQEPFEEVVSAARRNSAPN